jgi:hypothetical protein
VAQCADGARLVVVPKDALDESEHVPQKRGKPGLHVLELPFSLGPCGRRGPAGDFINEVGQVLAFLALIAFVAQLRFPPAAAAAIRAGFSAMRARKIAPDANVDTAANRRQITGPLARTWRYAGEQLVLSSLFPFCHGLRK